MTDTKEIWIKYGYDLAKKEFIEMINDLIYNSNDLREYQERLLEKLERKK